MNRKRLLYLIDQYKSQKSSPEERSELDHWYERLGQQPPYKEVIPSEQHRRRIWLRLMQKEPMASLKKSQQETRHSMRRIIRSPFLAAAVLLLVFGGMAYLYYGLGSSPSSEAYMEMVLEDVIPGGNKATLTLSDGSTVDLSTLQEGKGIHQNGLNITKIADGVLTYQAKSATKSEIDYHTITIPRGGQYQVVLPDGTLVWLNAASTLTYPANFQGGHREVELSGEAYFEVAKRTNGDKRVPFVVKTQEQEIQVLGTHFNVKAYKEEGKITTTLLEGKVKVVGYPSGDRTEQSHILQVGQAARWENGKYAIETVDVERAVAWKNGKFVFSGENIKTIMNNIARWYDVRVEYQGDLSDVNFEGAVSRYENIIEVLRKLELTGTVHFKAVSVDKPDGKERRIIVMP